MNYSKNIENIFKQAKPYQIAQGKNWYRQANAFCEEISQSHNLPTWKVALIVSALSPRNKWHRNKLDAINLIEKQLDGKYSTFNSNRDKAINILGCENILQGLSLLGKGKKTRAFFFNIYNPKSKVVCVDSWACRIAGHPKDSPTPKQYDVISDAYKKVASKFNMTASELQAITWCVFRGAAA